MIPALTIHAPYFLPFVKGSEIEDGSGNTWDKARIFFKATSLRNFLLCLFVHK